MKTSTDIDSYIPQCEIICNRNNISFRGFVGSFVGMATIIDAICNKCDHNITQITLGKLLHGGKVVCGVCKNKSPNSLTIKIRKEASHAEKCETRCKDLGLNFIGWKGVYVGGSTLVDARCILCGSDVTKKTTISSLINTRKYGCIKCVPKVDINNKSTQITGNLGYIPAKKSTKDHLYLIEIHMPDGVSMIKVGRAFDMNRRMKQLERDSGGKVSILKIISDTHYNIFLTETKSKMDLYPYRHGGSYKFSGYTTECYKHVVLQTPSIQEIFYWYKY